jgi:hypothetical protein
MLPQGSKVKPKTQGSTPSEGHTWQAQNLSTPAGPGKTFYFIKQAFLFSHFSETAQPHPT